MYAELTQAGKIVLKPENDLESELLKTFDENSNVKFIQSTFSSHCMLEVITAGEEK